MAHSGAYTALIRIPLLILRREIARQLSLLPRHSHIEFVCQLKAYPLEMKTELKPTFQLRLVQRQIYKGKDFVFFLPFQNKFFSLPFLKFMSNIYLLNPKFQNPGSPTQDPPHSPCLFIA